MKLKAYLLLVALWIAPALAMEEQLTAETIANHPKFLVVKQAFEEIGGSIEVFPTRLWMEIKYRKFCYGETVDFGENFSESFESAYSHCLELKKRWELCSTRRESLRSLCIWKVAAQCQAGNQEIINRLKELQGALRSQIDFVRFEVHIGKL